MGWKGYPKGSPEWEAWRQRCSDAAKRRMADPALRARISEKLKANLANPEKHAARVAQIRASILDKPEVVSRRARSLQDHWDNPEEHRQHTLAIGSEESKQHQQTAQQERWRGGGESARLAHGVATREGMSSDAVREKLSESAHQMWANPEMRTRALERLRAPERLRVLSETIRQKMADPEYKVLWLKAYDPERQRKDLLARRVDPEFERKRISALADRLRPSSLEMAVRKVLDRLGIDYTPQHPLGPYVVDLYLSNWRLVIECDGSYWHSLPKAIHNDKRKNTWLKNHGYLLLRLTEAAIKRNAEQAVTEGLEALLKVGSGG